MFDKFAEPNNDICAFKEIFIIIYYLLVDFSLVKSELIVMFPKMHIFSPYFPNEYFRRSKSSWSRILCIYLYHKSDVISE